MAFIIITKTNNGYTATVRKNTTDKPVSPKIEAKVCEYLNTLNTTSNEK